MAFGYLRYSGIRVRKHLGHSGTWALRKLRNLDTWSLGHLGTQTLKALGYSSIWALRLMKLLSAMTKINFRLIIESRS